MTNALAVSGAEPTHPAGKGTLAMQFRLQTVFAVFVCVAIGCALLFTTPSYVAVPALIFLSFAIPAILAAVAVYTRGASRAFCIGGLIPSSFRLYTMGWIFAYALIESPEIFASVSSWNEFCEEIDPGFRATAAFTWVMIVLIGAIVVAVRYFAQRVDQTKETPNNTV